MHSIQITKFKSHFGVILPNLLLAKVSCEFHGLCFPFYLCWTGITIQYTEVRTHIYWLLFGHIALLAQSHVTLLLNSALHVLH